MGFLQRTICMGAAALLVAPLVLAEVIFQEIPSSPSWQGMQALGTDSKHRVYVLNTESLEVHPLTTEGVGGSTVLEPAAGHERSGNVLAASMGDTPGDWLLRTGAYEALWFRGREEKPLPSSPWLIHNVLLAGGAPVAAVAPIRSAFGLGARDAAPLLAQIAGHSWGSLLSADPVDEAATSSNPEKRQTAYRHHRWKIALHLAADPAGRIWLADRHAFRLREITQSGKLRTTLTLDPNPQMEITERAEEEIEQIRKAASGAGRSLGTPSWLKEQPQKAILGMTAGWDGRIYVITPGEGDGPRLYRWDSLRLALESTRIAGAEVPTASNLDLAAGRDGLYVAQRADELGRWFVSWEALEQAEWQAPEETVYLDGTPLEQVVPPETSATSDGAPVE